ncbi:MAG: Flp pilus assembly protein CpaB [Gammaproteobacteria bacterium]
MAKKEEKSALPLLAGAVGFGIVAAILAMLYLNAREKQLKAQYEQDRERQVMVVVANSDLQKGQEINSQYFSQRPVPADFVHGDAVAPGDFERYAGSALTADLERGKPLLKSFIDQEFPRDFSDIIPKGKRAITITVDDVNSIGGFLRPGNRIDLFVNIPFATSGFNPQLVTEAKEAGLLELLPSEVLSEIPEELLAASGALEDPASLLGMLSPTDVVIPVIQNITVLATGRDPYQETLDRLRQPQRRTETNFSNITLEVTPEQAALVTLAEDKGELVSLLRNRNDQSASDFTSLAPADLFGNASRMAAAEAERASRASVAGGVDVNGNLVDANGNKIMSAEQLAAAGYTVNENGQIVDKDGNVVNPEDMVVTADGTVMTKQQLAAAGLTVNESGQVIDANGNVVNANDVVVASDGSVMTKEQLAAAGLSVNENGEIVDANGKVVNASDLVVSNDGTVMTKEKLEALEAAGYTVNENGDIVDKDGNVIDPNDVVIAADGSVMTKEQLAAAGLSINENGEIVDANGNVVDKNDLITSANGEILSKQELAKSGYRVNANGEIVDARGNVVSDSEISKFAQNQSITGSIMVATEYDLIIGGASEDGVAKSKKVALPPEELPAAKQE